MVMDLSTINDHRLTLILLRVPVKDLLKSCIKVSRQWNRILSDNHFWRNKMAKDGYQLESSKLVGLSTEQFKFLALTHCIDRNFIKDSWDLELQNRQSLTLDPRWNADRIEWQTVFDDNAGLARIEIPPFFPDGEPEMPPGYDKQIEACVALGGCNFRKRIIIKLADEGLTDNIMDIYRPTIVVSEMVTNPQNGFTMGLYQFQCSLEVSPGASEYSIHRGLQFAEYKGHREFRSDENGRWVGARLAMDWQNEGWNRMEHSFKDYPTGMRYLVFSVEAFAGLSYCVKLANCSVKALCEKNAKE